MVSMASRRAASVEQGSARIEMAGLTQRAVLVTSIVIKVSALAKPREQAGQREASVILPAMMDMQRLRLAVDVDGDVSTAHLLIRRSRSLGAWDLLRI
mmetsp:Transcript_23868/g.55565  ORF Transcript_23868/g.55565 Transcript_23868/m.55565 type:complete len:98 (+) Transcript_23868:211-504(+)